MKMLKRVVPVFFTLPFVPDSALADIEFGASVPREVVEQFVGNAFGGGGAKLYSDILSAFPPFAVPDGFEVLASADQGQMQRVILRTSLDEDAVRAALSNAFVPQGWMEMPYFGANAPQTGFVSAMPPPQPLQLCSDQLGRINVSVNGTNPRYVSLIRNIPNAFGSEQTCADQAAMSALGPMARMNRPGMEILQYVPTLVVPEADVAGSPPARGIMSGGGGSDDYEVESRLLITWSADELFEHFAEQVNRQGWQADAAVSGTEVAFGSWTKTVAGTALLGMLTVTQIAENSWELKFRILRQR